MRTKISRSAFTSIDVVVAGIAVALFFAILLPVVNYGREAARRRQCISNAKLIAQASLNYESTYQSYPAASASCTKEAWHSTGRPGNTCTSPNWLSLLMDFLDQREISDNLRKCMMRNHHAAEDCVKEPFFVGATTPSVFRCPSSTTSRNYGSSATGLSNLSKGNYAGCMGASTFLHSVEDNKFIDDRLRAEFSPSEFDAIQRKQGIMTVRMIPGWQSKVLSFHHGGHG